MAFTCTTPAVPTLQEDNDQVRITRWDFPPGANTGWHEHAFRYCVVMLTEGTLAIHDGAEVKRVPLAAGQSYSRPAGITHDVMNDTDHSMAFVEVEMKR